MLFHIWQEKMKFKVKLRFRNGKFVFAPMVKDYDGKWKYFVKSVIVEQEATTINVVEFNKKVDAQKWLGQKKYEE